MNAHTEGVRLDADPTSFPLDRWYVAGFAWELADKPVGRTLLSRPLVLFRTPDGRIAALEDRCCHRDLPLSCGSVEQRGLRCGYHGLLFDGRGSCIEIPGQDRIPARARVRAYDVRERDAIVWVWFGSSPDSAPDREPPAYPVHSDPGYTYGGGVVHYAAPYQLIHDNLLDLSHLGYVHLKTIGGNAPVHTSAAVRVEQDGEVVRIVRRMQDSAPPPTYSAAWPFSGNVDRWQEVEFHPSHLLLWAGAMDAGSGRLDDPQRAGFHLRGLHGVTPETATTTHYFWTIASNRHPSRGDVTQLVVDQTAATFEEDKVVIEAQYRNQLRFGATAPRIDLLVDAAPIRARRVIAGLVTSTERSLPTG